MKVIEVEGKSVDEATKKAMENFGVKDPSAIRVEVLEQGKSGLFGFGVSKQAKIRAFLSQDTAEIASVTKEVISEILSRMGLNTTIKETREIESKVYVELESSESSGIVIGRKGKTLEALQFMVNLIVGNRTGTEKKIILDIEDYRDKREKALRKLSKEIALKVVRTGKPWTLEPMNPFERRLIHLALQNDSRVMTKSEGQGIYRKIKVMPKDSQL